MKLKGLLFIPLAGALASLAFAAASTLTVDAGTNQAGGEDLTDCDTDGVHIGYKDEWFNGHDFLKTAIYIKDIDCVGHDKSLIVVLTDDHGNSLWTSSPQSLSTGNPNFVGGVLTVPIPNGIPAEDVHDAHVAIGTNAN
jgi:hypothetical protein